MNRSGKTSTILLIIIAIILLSLTAISFYFYQNESVLRKDAESRLAKTKALTDKLEAEVKDSKKQVSLLEEKNKEADEKINSLMDELELQEGVRDQMKSENSSLKEALQKESQDKQSLHGELVAAQEKAASLEERLKSEEKLRADLEARAKEMEQKLSQQQQQQKQDSEVELEKIVVKPGEAPEARVISINEENNFVIFNLGQESGIKQGMILSVYRGDKYLGDVKVARAQEGMSVADFVAPLTKAQVKKDDRVVVKK